jgi:hypothetical protein
MVRRWLALVLVATVAAGCLGSGPGAELRSQWLDEAAAHEPFGAPATLSLAGAFSLHGTLSADVEAPFSLRVQAAPNAKQPYVLLHGARVPGVGNGTVVVQGPTIQVVAGELAGATLGRAISGTALDLYARETGSVSTRFVQDAPGWDGVRDTEFFGMSMEGSLREAELAGFARAALLRGTEAIPLASPIRLSADGLSLAEGTAFRVPSVRLAADEFQLGGPLDGTLVPEGGTPLDDPTAVSGLDATFSLAPGSLGTEGTFRLTQAIHGGRLLHEARLEAAVASSAVQLSNGTGLVDVSYREHSFLGDAVLSAVRLRGAPAGTSLTVSPARAPLVLAVPSVRTEGPVRADAPCTFLCGFGPGRLPQWVGAGEVGRFDIVVQGRDGQEVAFTLVLEGNFPTVELPVVVSLGAPAAPAPGKQQPGASSGGFPLWLAAVAAVGLAGVVAVSWLVASRRARARAAPATAPAAVGQPAPPPSRHAGGPHPVRRGPPGS